MSRGRDAELPTEIPKKGWMDIAFRVSGELATDHVLLIGAGVAFYGLLAIFPAITALMALGGLILDPSDVTEQLKDLARLIPKDAAKIILDQAVDVAGSKESGLGFTFLSGLLLALFSASKGMGSLMEGLNVAYDEKEKRGFVTKTLWTFGLTVFLIVGLLTGLLAALVLPTILNLMALPTWLEAVLAFGRWVILAALTMAGLAAIYRYGPSRTNAQWMWLTPGAIAACTIWLAASIGFSVYVDNFGSYNESFGSIAGVIILLLWLWISACIVLVGAELNAEIEAQTALDTTVGPDKPMGRRGAQKADTLGVTRSKV